MKLKEYMTWKGVKASELAQVLDCSEAVIHDWCSSRSLPSLMLMARLELATEHEVEMEDFVGEVTINKLVHHKRTLGRPIRGPSVEGWIRSKGIKAVGMLIAQIPGAPSRRRLQLHMEADPRPRWQLKGRSKPSVWVASSALEVSDSYRIVQALRGRPPVLAIEVERLS